MAQNNFCTYCTGCDTEHIFPAVEQAQDCNDSVAESQVCGVLIVPDGTTPPADWTAVADWVAIVNNSATVNTSARWIEGIGGVAVADKTVVTVAKGVQMVTMRRYTLEFQMLNLSSLNREFARALQCNPTNFTFWIYTLSERLFGGSTGIAPIFTDADLPLLAGENDIESGNLTFQWRSKCDPDRAEVTGLDTSLNSITVTPVVFSDGAGTVFSDGAGTVFVP